MEELKKADWRCTLFRGRELEMRVARQGVETGELFEEGLLRFKEGATLGGNFLEPWQQRRTCWR